MVFLFVDISDHLPIFSIMIDDVNCLAVKSRTIQTYRDMRDKNIENFKDRLTHCEWSPLQLKKLTHHVLVPLLSINSLAFTMNVSQLKKVLI